MKLTPEERYRRWKLARQRWQQKTKAINNAKRREKYRAKGPRTDEDRRKRMQKYILYQERKAGRAKPETCEVCGGAEKVSFDHCHQRGIFRGWLCYACNRALGCVKDDPNRLRKLIVYLERTKDFISPQLTLPGI